MKELSDIIIEKITRDGPVSFHDYMELCLYHPEKGYYTSEKNIIGKHGDFYTASNLSALFGAAIAKQLREMWQLTGKKKFAVVEYGAGTGMLCRDILDHLEKDHEFYSKLDYYIIEKSPAMRQKEKSHLPEKVRWINSLSEIHSFTGCVLSNELLDNFAVHKVRMEEQLMEVFVDHDDGFVEVLKPAGEKLVNYFKELNVVLPTGFITEVNLEATEWIEEIALHMKKGYVLTIDYGYLSRQLYGSGKRNGTVLCYYQHSINDQPYTNIGKQDITCHINFSALSHWGAKNGLEECGFVSLASFLVAIGWEDQKEILANRGNGDFDFRRYAFLKYTLLMDMGQKFKILLQSKDMPAATLKGFTENKLASSYSLM